MRTFLICFLMTLSASLSAQDVSLFEAKIYEASDGHALPYRILWPENYEPDQEYPLVLFLHGAGERGNDNQAQLKHGVRRFLEPKAREQHPCIVIAPQCAEGDYWSVVARDEASNPYRLVFDYNLPITASLQAAMELVREVIRREGVDKDRVYLTGLSMGGMGTFEAVYRFPKLFAAAAPVCGGGQPEAYRKQHAKVPFWIFHGDEDPVVDVALSRAMHQRLQALGADVTYSEYPGVKHNSWDNAYAEPELLEWMFSKGR